MTATGIVFLFSGLSAASSGAHGSVRGMLAMLIAMRYIFTSPLGFNVSDYMKTDFSSALE